MVLGRILLQSNMENPMLPKKCIYIWENHRTPSLARSQHEHWGIFPNNGDYFTDLDIDGNLYFPQFQPPNYFQKP
jgi:hypothetical protein